MATVQNAQSPGWNKPASSHYELPQARRQKAPRRLRFYGACTALAAISAYFGCVGGSNCICCHRVTACSFGGRLHLRNGRRVAPVVTLHQLQATSGEVRAEDGEHNFGSVA